MSILTQSILRNGLLKALTPSAFEMFTPHLTLINLPLKFVLVEANEPTLQVCFVESGLASMVATSPDDETVEIGHIGREGMTGEHLALLSEQTPNRTFMQVAGTGYIMPASIFTALFRANSEILELFLHYVQSCGMQLGHSALANARYSVNERLARWLLMVHDRTDGDDLPLTHEFLGVMLGVRRSGVTDQVHILEGVQAIKATRGNIRVLNREKLLDIAAGCYGIPEAEYERLIGASLRLSR
jgi:CRP-like cAMP-binding protein